MWSQIIVMPHHSERQAWQVCQMQDDLHKIIETQLNPICWQTTFIQELYCQYNADNDKFAACSSFCLVWLHLLTLRLVVMWWGCSDPNHWQTPCWVTLPFNTSDWTLDTGQWASTQLYVCQGHILYTFWRHSSMSMNIDWILYNFDTEGRWFW